MSVWMQMCVFLLMCVSDIGCLHHWLPTLLLEKGSLIKAGALWFGYMGGQRTPGIALPLTPVVAVLGLQLLPTPCWLAFVGAGDPHWGPYTCVASTLLSELPPQHWVHPVCHRFQRVRFHWESFDSSLFPAGFSSCLLSLLSGSWFLFLLWYILM